MKVAILFLGTGILIGVLAMAWGPQNQNVTQRISMFENPEVKVWKTIIMPNQPLSMHRHEHPRVIVALVGGKLKVVKQGGQATTMDWESGKAYWLTSDPPNELHGDVNDTGKPIEVMVVELQKAK